MSGYYNQGPPPQQFGYPQQGWGAPPPQQQFGGHPGHFQQPPPQQPWGPPGQGPQFGAPPQGPPHGYNAPPGQHPGQQGFQQFPPQQQGFHQPPPQQFQPQQQVQNNTPPDIDGLMRAMSGFKRDHKTIINILAKANPEQMAMLRQMYAQRNNNQSLESKVDSSFRNHYGDTLVQLVRGPLLADVHNINRAIKGLGTKEDMLNDVLIGRSNADMHAIKSTYQSVFRKSLESDVEGDLSLKTKTMFQLIMRASRTEDNYPYNPAEISRDAEALHYATRGPSMQTNQEQVFTILTQRSDNQIRAIALDYQNKYHKSLEDTIRANFSGHMEDALLLALGRATDRAKTDAYALEDTMKGMGTKDDLLVNRVVRIHWNTQHMDQVKKAYQHFFKRDLKARVHGETSGDYREALIACLG